MRSIFTVLMMVLLSVSAFAYDAYDYVTPDNWSKHITANGVRANANGIDLTNGTLKLGYTTRGYFGMYDNDSYSNDNIYQYFRARLSDVSLLEGTVYANFNVRGAWDLNSYGSTNERHVFSSSYEIDKWEYDSSLRIYQANAIFDNVVPMTNISVGRIYLDLLSEWKIDGIKVIVAPLDLFKVGAYYGLPVSYYTDLETQAFGAYFEVPIEFTNTKIRAEASYFTSTKQVEESLSYDTTVDIYGDTGVYQTTELVDTADTLLIKARVDQYVNAGDILDANIYLEGAMLNNAYTYDIGFNSTVFPSGTLLTAYVMGQFGNNEEAGSVNEYVSSYESFFNEGGEHIMYGVMLSQGITRYTMLSAGFESKHSLNDDDQFSNTDYIRAFGQLDLIGLLHRNNYISLIADYYNVYSSDTYYENSKLLGGFRVSQVVNDNINLWAGSNVMNYQFHSTRAYYTNYNIASGAGSTSQEDALAQLDTYIYSQSENNAYAYIGGQWQITDWCVVSLDYTYEYSSIFESYDLNANYHIVQAWVNLLF